MVKIATISYTDLDSLYPGVTAVGLVEISSVSAKSPQRYFGIGAAMHRDRKRVFVDELNWNVPVVDGEYEVDQFDDEHATYLIVADASDPARHLGSVRLLPTERPHILGDIFPQLCAGEVPRGPNVMEITRLCIAPDVSGLRANIGVRRQLAVALTHYGLKHGIDTYTLVCLSGHLPQVLAAGWDVEPLGLPADHDGQSLCAARIAVSAEALAALKGSDFLRRRSHIADGQRESMPLAA